MRFEREEGGREREREMERERERERERKIEAYFPGVPKAYEIL